MNIQKKYKKISTKLKEFQNFLSLKRKTIVWGIIAVPLTSAGAGMTIYIDNTSNIAQTPIFAQEAVIDLDESVDVEFAVPIQNTEHYEASVVVYPQTNMTFIWNEKQTLLTIIPKTTWNPQTEYSIAFPHNSYEATVEQSTIFSFETVAYPTAIDTSLSESNNRYVDEGDDIVIVFDNDIADFDVHAVTRPILKTEQVYDEQTRTLRVQIKERAQNYKGFHSLTLFAKHKKQQKAQFYPIYSLTFNTLLPKPDNWPKIHVDRLNIAKLSTAPSITDGKYIDVNLDAQITTLFENGEFIANFVSSAGAIDTPTPTGEFEIYNKHPYALSNMFQVYLPYWMAFTADGKYGFHDLVVWPEGHEDMPSGGKESERSIGSAVSPGCVRHDADNSQFIYNWTDVGTQVVIY